MIGQPLPVFHIKRTSKKMYLKNETNTNIVRLSPTAGIYIRCVIKNHSYNLSSIPFNPTAKIESYIEPNNMRRPLGLKIHEILEIFVRILYVPLALASLGVSIAMGILPSNYKMDPLAYDDFGGENYPFPTLCFVCKINSFAFYSNSKV
jgi:hypothetical protein